MMWGPIVVILLRLIVPFSIFRWPLAGGIACLLLDACDVILITFFNQGDFKNYPGTDKYLDTYYLFFEFIVSFKWKNKLARKTSIGLFIYRFLGVVLFETLKIRALLFVFPNLFENFYLFYLALLKFYKKDIVTSKKRITVILVILLVPKLFQEYILHVAEFHPWNWIRHNILGMSR